MAATATSPRQKAERCFALARSTTFPGERDAAIKRGEAIAAKANLDLDTFDIPGRQRKRAARSSSLDDALNDPTLRRDGSFDWSAYQDEMAARTRAGQRSFYARGDKAPEFYSAADVSEAMARFQAAMRGHASGFASAAEAGRRMKDAVDEFVARAADGGSRVAAGFEAGKFDAAMKRRPARDAQQARWPDIAACVSFLFSRGVPVYDMGVLPEDDDGRWYVPGRPAERVDDDGLRAIADEVAG